jgi:hypothetical protein
MHRATSRASAWTNHMRLRTHQASTAHGVVRSCGELTL